MVKSTVFLPCLVMFILFNCHQTSAQPWNFVKEKNGIKIYTRAEENSSFKSYKGETILHAGMQIISRYIGNVKNFSWWDKNIRELRVLDQQSSDNKIRYYFVYQVPWPLNDRDFCVDVTIDVDSVSGEKVVFAQPYPEEIPERKGIVRIKKYWQRWTLHPIGKNAVNATLEGFVDPGGNVPSWLYNMVIVETPLKVMEGIKMKVEENPTNLSPLETTPR